MRILKDYSKLLINKGHSKFDKLYLYKIPKDIDIESYREASYQMYLDICDCKRDGSQKCILIVHALTARMWRIPPRELYNQGVRYGGIVAMEPLSPTVLIVTNMYLRRLAKVVSSVLGYYQHVYIVDTFKNAIEKANELNS